MKQLRQMMKNFKTVLYMYKLVWGLNKRYVVLFSVGILLNAVPPLFNVIMPKLIIDEVGGQRRLDVLIFQMLTLLGINLLLKLLGSAYEIYHSKASDDIKNDFHNILQDKVMKMNYQFLEQPTVLDSLKKAEEIITPTQAGFMDFGSIIFHFNSIISHIITIAGLLYVLVTLSWILFLVVAVIVIINIALNNYVKNREYETWISCLDSASRQLGYLQNIAVDNAYAKEVRINRIGDWICKKIENITNELLKKLNQMFPRYFWVAVVSNIIRSLQEGGVYLYIGYQCIMGYVSIGDFTMQINAIMTLTETLKAIAENILTINQSGKYIEEFISFIHLSSDNYDNGGQIAIQGERHEIEFRNVWFCYPGQQDFVLRDISIKIRTGEKLAIVGDNGAGKSTFIKLLLGLYKPTQGQILLDGKSVDNYIYSDYLRCFSVVFQDFKTLAFSILENITYDLKEEEEEVWRILKDVGMEPKVKSLPMELQTSLSKLFDPRGLELSGGEQQKIAICNSIYRKGPLVIMDEPTAMLSPVVEYEIYQNFDKIVQQKTAIYISHRMSICRFCDHIAVFDKGRINEYGNHATLLQADGLYTKMFNAQAQYYQDLKARSNI